MKLTTFLLLAMTVLGFADRLKTLSNGTDTIVAYYVDADGIPLTREVEIVPDSYQQLSVHYPHQPWDYDSECNDMQIEVEHYECFTLIKGRFTCDAVIPGEFEPHLATMMLGVIPNTISISYYANDPLYDLKDTMQAGCCIKDDLFEVFVSMWLQDGFLDVDGNDIVDLNEFSIIFN